jgi:hypothetical protein
MEGGGTRSIGKRNLKRRIQEFVHAAHATREYNFSFDTLTWNSKWQVIQLFDGFITAIICLTTPLSQSYFIISLRESHK